MAFKQRRDQIDIVNGPVRQAAEMHQELIQQVIDGLRPKTTGRPRAIVQYLHDRGINLKDLDIG
jgi:hypothetical protein